MYIMPEKKLNNTVAECMFVEFNSRVYRGDWGRGLAWSWLPEKGFDPV